MELAMTAFTALAPEALGTAAAGAGGWVTTMTGAGATSGMLSALQGTASVGSMITSALGGGLGLMSGLQNASMARLNARSEELKSEAQAIEIQRDLVRKIGANRVAFAASGLDVSSSSAIEGSLRDQAQFQTDLARTSGDMAAASRRMQAGNAELQGYSSLIAAAGKLGRQGADYALDLSKRG